MKYIAILLCLFCISCADEKLRSEFACDNGWKLRFEVEPDTPEDALLYVNGTELRLHRTRSASGARYIAEKGLTGLIFWNKGNEVMLYEDEDSDTPLAQCRKL